MDKVPRFGRGDGGSIPSGGKKVNEPLAQLVEQLPLKQWVLGSSPKRLKFYFHTLSPHHTWQVFGVVVKSKARENILKYSGKSSS